MNRGFREDENELPYLLFEKRDDFTSQSKGSSYGEDMNLDSVLASLYISPSKRNILKGKLVEFLNAKDCTGLRVEDGFDGCDFIFTQKNEYIESIHRFEYVPQMELKRVFSDCYSTHNHDRLLADSRFRKLVEKTGFEFMGCRGGYVANYSMKDDEFTMTGEMEVLVSFKVGLKERVYQLDLDRMEFEEQYFEYSL